MAETGGSASTELAVSRPARSKRQLYLARVCVTLDEPAKIQDKRDSDSAFVTGYVRVLGIAADCLESATQLCVEVVSDGSIDWTDSRIDTAGVEDLPPRIRAAALSRGTSEVWYQSGRVFFGEDNTND